MNEDDFRRIVREEVRREVQGAVCPECSEPQPASAMEIDRMIADKEDHDDAEGWHIWCDLCNYRGQPESFDPANQTDF